MGRPSCLLIVCESLGVPGGPQGTHVPRELQGPRAWTYNGHGNLTQVPRAPYI